MKYIKVCVLMLLPGVCFGQNITLESWNQEAITDIRFWPKYHQAAKSPAQIEADAKFIKATRPKFKTDREASEELVRWGFHYLYRDTRTSMFRFNQAFLLDSTNANIYWGFGSVYLILGDTSRARVQYEEGLRLDPGNTNILTDFATLFIVQASACERSDPLTSRFKSDSALIFLNKSYQLDKRNPNTVVKLCGSYLRLKDCAAARRYYEECAALGGRPITDELTDALSDACPLK